MWMWMGWDSSSDEAEQGFVCWKRSRAAMAGAAVVDEIEGRGGGGMSWERRGDGEIERRGHGVWVGTRL